MVKSLKFLRHRRTEAGYFSEFLIAKTPGDVENCEPQRQPQATVVFAPASTAVITSVQLLPQPHQSMASYGLYSMQQQHHPAIVARHEVVVANVNNGGEDCVATEPAAHPASRPTPPRQRQDHQADTCGTRLARRRERNRTAAAKCRQRRQDRLDYLAECVRQLESDNGDLEAEVAELATARAQLESTVRAHLARCDSSPLNSTYAAAAAQAAADFAASPLDEAASVWLAPPTPPAVQQQPAAACRRPTSLALSASSSSAAAEDASVVSMEIPSLTTPRTAGIGSGLTPFLATPLSAFKMESM